MSFSENELATLICATQIMISELSNEVLAKFVGEDERVIQNETQLLQLESKLFSLLDKSNPSKAYNQQMLNALRHHIVIGSLDQAITQPAYEQGLSAAAFVESYFQQFPFDTTTLAPLSGEVKPFHAQIKELTKPYLYIGADNYQKLMQQSADFYETPTGQVVTFGFSNGDYYLMPLQPEHAQNIKALQMSSTARAR